MRIVYKFRSSRLEALHEKYLRGKFWKSFTKTHVVESCFSKIAKLVTILKKGLHRGCFPGDLAKSVKGVK